MTEAARLPLGASARKAWASGPMATFAAMVGLTCGPSTIALIGLGVFFRPLEAQFGWGRAQIALVTTVINITIVLLSPVQGWLVDRYGSRRIVLPSMFLFAVGLMLLYFLPGNILVFYAAWSLLAAVSVGLLPGSYLRVVGTWFNKRLGLALGLANCGIGLGSIFIPLIATSVIVTHGWRMAYVALGLFVLVVALPTCTLWLRERRDVEPRGSAPTRGEEKSLAFGAAASSMPFRVIVVAFVLLGLISAALVTQQVPMLIDAGLTPQKAALVQSVFGIFLIVGRLGTGALLDRVFAPILMIVVSLGAAVGCLIDASGTTTDIVFVAAALFGLVFGAEFDVLAYLIKRYFGMEAFGIIYGVIFALFQLGSALGSPAFAFSREAFGGYRFGLYGAAFVLLMACVTFACLPKYPAPLQEDLAPQPA